MEANALNVFELNLRTEFRASDDNENAYKENRFSCKKNESSGIISSVKSRLRAQLRRELLFREGTFNPIRD